MRRILLLLIIPILLICGCARTKKEVRVSEFAATTQTDKGTPAGIVMTTYTTTMLADGRDETLMRVTVVDITGREITTARVPITINITGDASVAAAKNGSPVSLTNSENGIKTYSSEIIDGVCPIRLIAGTREDRIKVEVKAEKMWPGSHEIHTINAGVKLMKPAAGQIVPVTNKVSRSIGADISFLPEFEDKGMKYYDNGKEEDLVKILADNGINYIRLRIFVDPGNEKGYSPGKGYCGLKYTKLMAARAKKYGMKLLLNFHYSDYWADPQQQNKPLAWKDLPFDLLKDSVKSYTKRVILALKEQGTPPDMVQVGNEINHGMLWPDGHISNLNNLAELIKSGVEGVREIDPSTPVMLHIALGGQNRESTFWLDNMIARGVDFDVIGLSYYPRWHGTLDDLKANLTDLESRYNKYLNVVEYAQHKNEICDIVFNLPGKMGTGTFIWEPIGIFFDKAGNITPELKGYQELATKYLQKPPETIK
jgi:arabinogalactan endo-1,4-beta-galactosidase